MFGVQFPPSRLVTRFIASLAYRQTTQRLGSFLLVTQCDAESRLLRAESVG